MSNISAPPYLQIMYDQNKAEAEERQAGLATAAQQARLEMEAAQRTKMEAEQRAEKLQEQLNAEQTAHKVCPKDLNFDCGTL